MKRIVITKIKTPVDCKKRKKETVKQLVNQFLQHQWKAFKSDRPSTAVMPEPPSL